VLITNKIAEIKQSQRTLNTLIHLLLDTRAELGEYLANKENEDGNVQCCYLARTNEFLDDALGHMSVAANSLDVAGNSLNRYRCFNLQKPQTSSEE
jgi:hypothetical protein